MHKKTKLPPSKLPLPAQKVDRETPEVRREIRQQLINTMWRKGHLKYLLWPNAQTALYNMFYEGLTPHQINFQTWICHRRMGKSTLCGVLLVERALQEPGSYCWFASDTRSRANEVLDPAMEWLRDFQAPMSVDIKRRGGTWHIRHDSWAPGIWSKICTGGLSWQKGSQLRGGKASMVVVDEAGLVRHLKIAVNEAISPMFLEGVERPALILIGTPPDNMAHQLVTVFIPEAKKAKHYACIGGDDNPDFTPEQKAMMIERYGSEESIGYQREILCRMIPNTDRLVFPRYNKMRPHVIVPAEEFIRPDKYFGYVSADFALNDFSGIIFSIVDWERKKMVVLDELQVNYQTTAEISELIHGKIHDLFIGEGGEPLCEIRLLADGTAQQLHDFRVSHNLTFSPANKHDRASSIQELRDALNRGDIEVLDSCDDLDYALANLTFKMKPNGAKSLDFERTETMGHGDVVDALRYMWRFVAVDICPYPRADMHYNKDTFRNPYDPRSWMGTGHDQETMETVATIFGKSLDGSNPKRNWRKNINRRR